MMNHCSGRHGIPEPGETLFSMVMLPVSFACSTWSGAAVIGIGYAAGQHGRPALRNGAGRGGTVLA